VTPTLQPEATRAEVALPRWVPRLFAVFCIGLIAWTIYLGFTLPPSYTVHHYDLSWVGFDVGVLIALLAVVWLASIRSPRVVIAAAVATTLLVVDAWFDITSAANRADFVHAVISAVVFEIPIALLCVWIARNAELMRSRRH